ncbi:hypothetical protein LCGC14_1648000 [marine sediment metagenome]|uniref:Uncharacterized protein n=1 Tax=marine sediment metagenome TaxID=412755 RepID=A0A0F9KDI0_9ZZZZ
MKTVNQDLLDLSRINQLGKNSQISAKKIYKSKERGDFSSGKGGVEEMRCKRCDKKSAIVQCTPCERLLCLGCYIDHVKKIDRIKANFPCVRYSNREARRKEPTR